MEYQQRYRKAVQADGQEDHAISRVEAANNAVRIMKMEWLMFSERIDSSCGEMDKGKP